MKDNLKKITDKTLQDLLQNEIILPSSYFESFDKNSKDLSVDIKDPQFENEVNNLIVDEFKNINNYMKKTVKNIDLLAEATHEAQTAIIEKDDSKLQSIHFSLTNIKNEIKELKSLIYLDPLTKTFNRRWIYNHNINKDGTLKHKGLLAYIDCSDCNYIAEQYGNLLADNVILYITKFLNQKLNDQNIDAEIARYSNNQFILFTHNERPDIITSFLKNISLKLANTTLKSKTGLMLKTNFHYAAVSYIANENFQDVIEKAASLSNQNKETKSE